MRYRNVPKMRDALNAYVARQNEIKKALDDKIATARANATSIAELLRRRPSTLYHYTNQRGLRGIIQSRKIWASNVMYLNDASELSHALRVIRKRVNSTPWRMEWRTQIVRTIDELLIFTLEGTVSEDAIAGVFKDGGRGGASVGAVTGRGALHQRGGPLRQR
jgi:hypothetical protein